jgi:peptide/nickel transport system substrate-binding protein
MTRLSHIVRRGAALSAFAALLMTGAATAQDKVLVVVLPEAPVNLDACNANNTANGRLTRINIYEPLTVVSIDDGSIQPRLATSWEQVDPLTWVFKLREGVTFHDGAPFNAQAVITELTRTTNPDRNCKPVATAIDDLTVEIKTDVPVPILPTYMSTLVIGSPNQPMVEMATSPIGTGPYVWDGEDAGLEMRTKKNPNWWGEASNVESVRYIWRPDSLVRASMIEVGEADLTPDLAVQDATNPALDIPYIDAETTWLRIDTEVPPLNDIRVRQALNYALARRRRSEHPAHGAGRARPQRRDRPGKIHLRSGQGDGSAGGGEGRRRAGRH